MLEHCQCQQSLQQCLWPRSCRVAPCFVHSKQLGVSTRSIDPPRLGCAGGGPCGVEWTGYSRLQQISMRVYSSVWQFSFGSSVLTVQFMDGSLLAHMWPQISTECRMHLDAWRLGRRDRVDIDQSRTCSGHRDCLRGLLLACGAICGHQCWQRPGPTTV